MSLITKNQLQTSLQAVKKLISLKADKNDLEGMQKKIDKVSLDVVGRKGSGMGSVVFNKYNSNIASGEYSFASGKESSATGKGSFAANESLAEGEYSHAVNYSQANGLYSHSEGEDAQANGRGSHAEGYRTKANGRYSHSEGEYTIAADEASHAEGSGTIAHRYQHAQGKFNIEDSEPVKTKYAHIVGNGKSDEARSNAHTLDWDGNAWFSGDVYVGSTSGTNRDEGSKKLITAEEVPQSDWNQNDESANDYIKNRPFGENVTYTSMFSEKEFIVNSDDEGNLNNINTDYDDFDVYPTPGDILEVYINNIPYQVTVFSDEGFPAFRIDDPNCPVTYWFDGTFMINQNIVYDEYSFTAEMLKLTIDINYLDSKYLHPSSIIRGDVRQSLSDDIQKQARKNINAISMSDISSQLTWTGTTKAYHSDTIYITLDNENSFNLEDGVKIRIKSMPDLSGRVSPSLKLNVSKTDPIVDIKFNLIGISASGKTPWLVGSPAEFIYSGNSWVYIPGIGAAADNFRYGFIRLTNTFDDDGEGNAVSPNLLRNSFSTINHTSLETEDKTIYGAINGLNSNKADKTDLDALEDLVGTTSVQSQITSAIAELVDTAPDTLDTLGELATAIQENDSVIDTLDAAITNKQDKNMIVTITSTTADDGTKTYSADKTFEEIKNAINNGTNVYAKLASDTFNFLKLTNTNIWFNKYTPSSMLYQRIIITTNNSITYSSDFVVAKEYTYGGVKASAKSETDTIEAKIGEDGKLYVPEYPVTDAEISTESTNPVQNKVVKEYVDAAITNKADKTEVEALKTQVTATSLILADAITGQKYEIQIQNGQLVSFPVEE